MLLVARGNRRGRCRGRCWSFVPNLHLILQNTVLKNFNCRPIALSRSRITAVHLPSQTPFPVPPYFSVTSCRCFEVGGIFCADIPAKVTEMNLLEQVCAMFLDGLPTVNRSCVIHQNRVLRVERGQGDGIAVVVCLVNFPLLLFPRIVSRINEGNTSRTSEVNLEDYLLVRCPGMMNVICRKHEN
jgi:hypothetical protein